VTSASVLDHPGGPVSLALPAPLATDVALKVIRIP
jgi:hypothetical protein